MKGRQIFIEELYCVYAPEPTSGINFDSVRVLLGCRKLNICSSASIGSHSVIRLMDKLILENIYGCLAHAEISIRRLIYITN